MFKKIIVSVLLLMAVTSTNVVSATGIEDNFEDIEIKQILTRVQNLQQGKIGEILDRFYSNNKQWNWTLLEGSLPENTNAVTQLTDGGAVTIFDFDKLKKATNLAVARTIIHELVHAHLLLTFRYDANAAKEYPGIVTAWFATSNPDYNAIQHQEMAESFVDDIALALKEYNEGQYVFADDSVYIDLAWGGLDFENNTELQVSDKKRIQIRLVSAQLSIPEEEVSKKTNSL